MYYLVDKNSRELVRQSRSPFNIDEAVQPPDPLIQLKRVDDATVPNFNPALKKLELHFIDNDAAFTRTFRLVAVNLSPAEKAAYTEAQQDEVTRQQLKAAYQDLKNGVGTTAERAARLEKAVAWLLRQAVKD